MQIGDLNITFLEKITVREFQQIARINGQFQNKEIDEIELWNQLAKFIIYSINQETDKEKILNLILDMGSIEDYTALNEAVAKKIDALVNPAKKKELEYEYSKLFKWLGGTSLEEIKAVEVMKYMCWSYENYLDCPIEILEAIVVRMGLEQLK